MRISDWSSDVCSSDLAQRFGGGNPGIARADDLGPTADDRALDEPELAERRAPDIGQQLGNSARTVAAAGFRLGLAGQPPARFAHGAPHAIGGACPPSVHRSPTSCSPGTTSRRGRCRGARRPARRSEEHTSELQSLMRISYAVFCLIKKNNNI